MTLLNVHALYKQVYVSIYLLRHRRTTGWARKVGPQTHGHNSVKSKPIKKFSTGIFLGKFVVKYILKIPPHLAHVATPPFETFMSAK